MRLKLRKPGGFPTKGKNGPLVRGMTLGAPTPPWQINASPMIRSWGSRNEIARLGFQPRATRRRVPAMLLPKTSALLQKVPVLSG